MNENQTLVDCVEGADLIRINETGEYCWHEYDTEGDPLSGRFSVNYPNVDAAQKAWPNNVSWEQ